MKTKEKKNRYLEKMIKQNLHWLFIRGVIGVVFALSNIALGHFSKEVYDSAIIAGSKTVLLEVGIMYLIALIIFLAFFILQELVIVFINERNAAKLRQDSYQDYLKKPFIDMEKIKNGDLLTKLTSDVDNMKQLGGTVWLDIANSAVMLAILIWWMFSVDSLLGWLLLPAPLFFCIAMIFFSTKMFMISEKLQCCHSNTNSLTSQIVSGSNSIKLLMLQPMIKQRYSKSVSELAEKSVELSVANAKMQSAWNLFMIPYQAFFFLIAGLIYINNRTLSIGTILAFSNFIAFLIYPLMTLLGSVANLGNMFASKNRVWTILNYSESDSVAKEIYNPLQVHEDIIFNNIDFSYNDDENIIEDISFTIPKGKTTILWGRSGSGKSTIVKILLGLYQPSKGSVIFNSEISNAVQMSGRMSMSLLEQKPFIFEGTIKENILLGKHDANDILLREAATNACILDKIEQLPLGFETVLDEKIALSGGEKQRLALARTIIGNSDILILDEPTSALNKELSHKVMSSLKNNYSEATKVIITHDISLLNYGDYCVVVDNGKVIASGAMNDSDIVKLCNREASA